MGQKVNPVAFRTGIMEDWKSRWYASKKEFSELLVEDKKIRDLIKKRRESKLPEDVKSEGRNQQRGTYDPPAYPSISKIEIERTRDEVRVILFSAKPGTMIGRSGKKIEDLQNYLQAATGRRINLIIQEITKPDIVAQLIAEDIGDQLVRRSGFRRTMKNAVDKALQSGAKGIKIQLAGRLGGAEMARCEKQIGGSIPLSTLRAKIDYGFHEAKIAQGHIGIQVWINQGEYSEENNNGENAQTGQAPKNPKRSYKR
ncbi:MAG: 30S ribosomal protein S3 [Planctomycetaceae bacterium]|jgi:small subunit ribosomal protein S3|nr:30S ribosomal protein S3 [Planctomycetaceae bacterium]